MSQPLESRLSCFLLKRLHRLQRLDMYEAASCAGLLDQLALVPGEPEEGTRWVATDAALALAGRDKVSRSQFRKLLASGHGTLLTARKRNAYDDQFAEDGKRGSGQVKIASLAPAQGEAVADDRDGTRDLLSALETQMNMPSPAALAVALLIARGVASTFSTLDDLLAVFDSPSPAILIRAPVHGFERHVGELLDEGCVLPFWIRNIDVFERMPLTPDRAHRRAGKRRRVVHTASGRGLNGALTDRALQKIEAALRGSTSSFVIVDETPAEAQLPVLALTDAVIECGPLDHDLITRVLGLALALPPDQVSEAVGNLEVTALALDDLNLAIKPGRNLPAVMKALERLAAHRRTEADAGETEKDRKPKSGGRDRATAAEEKDATDVVVIQPSAPVDPDAGADSDRKTVPLVETLAGYGKAKDWALDLKSDIALWRDGQIPWSDLGAKLLLSGPPGTGKTLYATALSNSLQLPLIPTSVATWLEPGYLGDVLKLMSAVFEAAQKHAPCILFIDELDNIGTRSKSAAGRHDDYWISLINRLLVLLDGSLKTNGVVVIGATNRADAIDPALLRSGRLETHIAIELPDISTLTVILKHHLGHDLPSVLRSRPTSIAETGKTSTPHATQGPSAGLPSAAHSITKPSEKGDRA